MNYLNQCWIYVFVSKDTHAIQYYSKQRIIYKQSTTTSPTQQHFSSLSSAFPFVPNGNNNDQSQGTSDSVQFSRHFYCIQIQQAKQQNQEFMQNHMQFSNYPNGPAPVIGSPKFTAQNYPRPFDKTLPSNPIKHYSSNPNLSLEMTHPRPPSQPLPEHPSYNSPFISKNLDFRGQANGIGFGSVATQASSRGQRSEMTKSLIISDLEKHQTPQETAPSPKKQLFKNMPHRRAARMSETIEDLPSHLTQGYREENAVHSNKEINFFKNKEEGVGVGREERKEVPRPAPSFLNRANNDMKRSLVVQPTFQTNNKQLMMGVNRQPPRPKPRKVSVDDFVKIKQLGNGKYGRVYLVRQRYTNFVCALKVIQKSLLRQEEITDQFTREVKIQMFLNHPNIIKMYGCFHDATNIYIILEVGTGGQLYHQLKKSQPLSEAKIAFIMRQVCEAVNEIHSLRIIHRDIKPENIVLHDNIIKLCDFGWSVHQDNKLRTTFCGTPLYVCPQILKGREYDEKIDIWSIGIMMYEMVVGENPFKITREEQLIKIVKDEIKIPSYLSVSAEVRDFLDRCLQKNPNQRASIKELMNHSFFKKHQDKSEKNKIAV